MTLTLFLMLLLPSPAETIDQFGKAHAPDQQRSGYTVIDFAASWCQPCWKALPHLERLHKELPDLRILVISEDKEVAGRDKLVKRLGLTMPVIWDQGHVWARRYEPKGMPTTMILDPSGTVVYSHTGYSAKDWKTFLTKLNSLPNP